MDPPTVGLDSDTNVILSVLGVGIICGPIVAGFVAFIVYVCVRRRRKPPNMSPMSASASALSGIQAPSSPYSIRRQVTDRPDQESALDNFEMETY